MSSQTPPPQGQQGQPQPATQLPHPPTAPSAPTSLFAPGVIIPVSGTAHANKMPIAGTRDAPRFKGVYARDYLQQILDHGAANSIDKDDVVDFIVRYCDPEYRDLIRYRWEFDPDNSLRSWDEAAAEFIAIFGSHDEPPKLTIEEILRRIQDFASQSEFSGRAGVTNYYNLYRALCDPARKDKTLTETNHAHFFILGLPSSIKAWFNEQTPSEFRKRDNPLPIKDSLKILYSRFDENSSTYEPWRHDSKHTLADTLKTGFDKGALSRSATSTPQASASTAPTAKSSTSSSDPVDDLAEQLSRLSLPVSRRIINAVTKQHCNICDKRGKDLDHIPGIRTCTETAKLVDEGLVERDEVKRRFVLKGGRDIPSLPRGSTGSVAGLIRSMAQQVSAAFVEDHEATVNIQSLILETDEDEYGLDDPDTDSPTLSVSTLDYRMVYPTLRNGKETSNRYDPKKRPPNSQSARDKMRASADKPSTPPQPAEQAQPKPPQVHPPPHPVAPPVNVPKPPNPINREDGWQHSLPQNSKKQDKDVKMKDPGPKGPAFRISSEAEEGVDIDALFNRVIKGSVELTLAELLGIAPDLRKRFAQWTERKKQPVVHKANEAECISPDAANALRILTDETEPVESHTRLAVTTLGDVPKEDIRAFTVFMAAHASAFPSLDRRFFAMTTGIFSLTINDITFCAMIDSGSELNLISSGAPTATGCPVDKLGEFWSLRGLHGNPERLMGCMSMAPMVIGGYTFEHHLFVSRQPHIGAKFDIILGQPFLHWFSASISYSRSGEVDLLLWQGGDKDSGVIPTIALSVVHPRDMRNKIDLGPRPRSEQVPQGDAPQEGTDFQ